MAKAIEKGTTYLDKLCHKFYDEPKGHGERTGYVCRLCGGPLETYYCEERLYLVKCADCGTLALVKTVNPEVSASITLARPTLTPPNEWVSVEDRLPDTDGAYLVYAPTYTGGSSSSLDCIGGIMFSRFKHEKWSIESGYYKRPNCVTHWMPIPTPYDIDHIHISEPHEG